MMAFTVEEFNCMVNELLYLEEARFDMLVVIAERTLLPSIKKWCSTVPLLSCAEGYRDVMQDVHIKLIQKVIPRFLKKDGANGPVNNDPKGFKNWLFEVARNTFYDRVYEINRISNSSVDPDGLDIVGETDVPTVDIIAREEELARAFDIVLDCNVSVYKTLTWIAEGVFMIRSESTAIEAKALIEKAFSQKTLYEMRDMIIAASDKVSWMKFTPSQKKRIDDALDAPFDEDRCYGEVQYSDFFMKKGGKATISDWINRMNSYVKRGMENEADKS